MSSIIFAAENILLQIQPQQKLMKNINIVDDIHKYKAKQANSFAFIAGSFKSQLIDYFRGAITSREMVEESFMIMRPSFYLL